MVSTNNVQVTYSEQIYKTLLVETIPHHVFDNDYFIKMINAAIGGVL